MSQSKKVKIVVEESGPVEGGQGFKVYLEGDIERIGEIPEMELGTAEFWGWKLFKICGQVLQNSGALHSTEPMKPTN